MLSLLAFQSVAQQKYWIYFKDKTANSAIEGEDCYDCEINAAYLDSLDKISIEPICKSKWLNAVTAICSEEKAKFIRSMDFVDDVVVVNRSIKTLRYGDGHPDIIMALQQTHADTLIDLGLNGEGIKIGIIDGGFLDADKDVALNHFTSDKSRYIYQNFIKDENQNVFEGMRKNDDDHGTVVWKLIGGYDKRGDKYYGLATAADYYLARTDQGDREYRGEEDNWIEALEWLHDHGVRLVNSSLGYSTGFDDPSENYSTTDVDGKSSAITRAAQIATTQMKMILVLAAGNEGNDKFKVVSIPADARGVISVGATTYYQWRKQNYSSIGPPTLDYIKPDISCYSSTGTSFSAPIITGIIAALLQYKPGLNSEEISELLRQSSHLYAFPNNYLGYGVPDVRKILLLINGEKLTANSHEIHAFSDHIQLEISHPHVIVFHKSSKTEVLKEESKRIRHDKLVITRAENARYSTVSTSEEVWEIVWH